MAAPGSQLPANPSQQIAANRQLRQALLSSAPRYRKNLGNFNNNGIPGGTTRMLLFNVGVTTRMLMDVNASFDIGTATAVVSSKNPFNLLSRVKLTDYDNTDRVNCSGYQLWVLNCIRSMGQPYGYNNATQTAVLTTPIVPTSVAANQAMRFLLEVPIAFDPERDLRGAMLTQTAVGQAYLNVDWNSQLQAGANANDDAVYQGAATTTVVQNTTTQLFNINLFQEYLLPQSVGGQVPLPPLDLLTVYEIAGAFRTSDNLGAGVEKLINYPNLRSVIGVYFNYRNNGVLNSAVTDASRFRVIANGNNVIREYLPTDKLFEDRLSGGFHADLRKGTYWEMHRRRPIETALYGNVQYGFTPLSVTNTNFASDLEICFESFFTKNSTLPGLVQG